MTTTRGQVAAWRDAWTWRDREMFIIVEDDAELSSHWYRWLVNTWNKYGERPELAAVSLRSSSTGLGANYQERCFDEKKYFLESSH